MARRGSGSNCCVAVDALLGGVGSIVGDGMGYRLLFDDCRRIIIGYETGRLKTGNAVCRPANAFSDGLYA